MLSLYESEVDERRGTGKTTALMPDKKTLKK